MKIAELCQFKVKLENHYCHQSSWPCDYRFKTSIVFYLLSSLIIGMILLYMTSLKPPITILGPHVTSLGLLLASFRPHATYFSSHGEQFEALV